MIQVNTFLNFNPVSMLSKDNQSGPVMQSKSSYQSSFEDILNSTAQKNTSESSRDDNYEVKYNNRDTNRQTQRVDQNENTNQSQSSDKAQSASKQDETQKVAKKESSDRKNDNKGDSYNSLSDKDKAAVNEMAEKLNIKPEALMNLLQTLNIDFKSLMQNSQNLEQALQTITTAVESTVQKLNFNPTTLQNNDIVSKIQLLLNQQSNPALKAENINQNINIQNDKNQPDVQNTAVKLKIDSQDKTSQNDVQPQLNIKPQSKDDNVQVSQPKVDVSKEFEKKAFSQNSDNSSGDLSSNQQSEQNTGNSNVKTSDKVDMTSILNNIKVINLKTTEKDGAAPDITKIDTQNAIPMQQFEGLTDKVIPLKQAIQNINAQKNNIFSQVVENAKLILSDKQTEMEMNLKPENLGKLSIKIATENGLVMAKITTENEQVKAAIESNLAQLKEQLQQQGLSVQDFSVSVGQDNKQQLFQNQNAKSKNTKVQGIGQNTVSANESYVNRIMVNNPYLISDSSIDYTA